MAGTLDDFWGVCSYAQQTATVAKQKMATC